MDPLKQLREPVAEIRQQSAISFDNYGEAWIDINGVATKVPSIKAARALLAVQDKVRELIRADLDALGIRDKTEKVGGDDEHEGVELLPVAEAGVLQFSMDPPKPGEARAAADREAEFASMKNLAKIETSPEELQRIVNRVRRKELEIKCQDDTR